MKNENLYNLNLLMKNHALFANKSMILFVGKPGKCLKWSFKARGKVKGEIN